MGRTGLVKHTIATGDQRPVRLPPRRLPIAKEEIERERGISEDAGQRSDRALPE